MQCVYIKVGKGKFCFSRSWNARNVFCILSSFFYQSIIVCSPGLRAGKWLLSKRLPLQWHNPPPTPLAKGPRLRFYLGCQPHSSHFTVQTSTGTHTLTQGCNYCQGSQCRENGLQPTCYKVFPAGSLSMWIHFIPAILRTTGIRLIGDLFRDWIVVTEKPVMTLTSSFICLIYVSCHY